jgi:hypothetical protein
VTGVPGVNGDRTSPRAELERAFTTLADRLAQRGVIADVFVVNGAVMTLAYDGTHVTRDLDSLFLPHGVVHDAAHAVADSIGLPPRWLKEHTAAYVSGKHDPGRRRVFDHPNLRVSAASPRHVFALKVLAVGSRDIHDLHALAKLIGVQSAETALNVCGEFFPDEPVSPRAEGMLREVFG